MLRLNYFNTFPSKSCGSFVTSGGKGGKKRKEKKGERGRGAGTKEREANVAGNISVVDVLDGENKFILNN